MGGGRRGLAQQWPVSASHYLTLIQVRHYLTESHTPSGSGLSPHRGTQGHVTGQGRGQSGDTYMDGPRGPCEGGKGAVSAGCCFLGKLGSRVISLEMPARGQAHSFVRASFCSGHRGAAQADGAERPHATSCPGDLVLSGAA